MLRKRLRSCRSAGWPCHHASPVTAGTAARYLAAAGFGDVHFLCVGRPQRLGMGGAELSQLYACVDGLAPLLRRPCLVVGKSTVPVGTAAQLARRLARRAPAGRGAELAWNPEF